VAPNESRELIGTQGTDESMNTFGKISVPKIIRTCFRTRGTVCIGTMGLIVSRLHKRVGAYLMKWIRMRPHTI
jgi:hypothetical protein